MTITLSLDKATPSLNELKGLHWSRMHKLRGEWQWLVKAAVLNDRVTVKLLPKARITIERYGPRRLDHDNLVGGCKQLVDSLVREGFVKDDSPDHLVTQYFQHIDQVPRTIVHIEEMA
jgi:Holliday junction resolvase RusA-like endonuclease